MTARVRFEVPAEGPARAMVWEAARSRPRVARRSEDHRAHDVAFASGEIQLSGRLLLPLRAGRFPALVLLHGPGIQDRNTAARGEVLSPEAEQEAASARHGSPKRR